MTTEVVETPIRFSDDCEISAPLGIGCWAWGDSRVWGRGTSCTFESAREAYQAALECGVNFFDTAELYGSGVSETWLGKYVAEETDLKLKPMIASKFMPYPWRIFRSSISSAAASSRDRLLFTESGKPIDLYQIHGLSVTFKSVEALMEGMADAHESKLIKSIGVSNFSVDQMERAHLVLKKHGIQLASNQIEFSILRRLPELKGMLKRAAELDIKIIAYSPLAMGRLTGKYTRDNPIPDRRRFGSVDNDVLYKIVDVLKEIGDAMGKTPSQVALNWVICKGAIPICGAKNAEQVRDNVGCLGWRLSDEDVAKIDEVSNTGQTVFWQEGY